jgi:hypothetical protein
LQFHQFVSCAVLLTAATLCAAQSPSPAAPAAPPAQPADAAILQAAGRGDAGELRRLLQQGGNPRAAGPQRIPAIGYALTSKSPETLGVLLQAEPALANESLPDGHGGTHPILIYAAATKQPAMVAALLQGGR